MFCSFVGPGSCNDRQTLALVARPAAGARAMFQTVDAVIFSRFLTSGRTRPALCICERTNGQRVDVVVKRAESCDAGKTSLCREAVAACLAGDLGLPIPEPFWVRVPGGLIPTGDTSTLSFGSRIAGTAFANWHADAALSKDGLQRAAEVFLFDGIIQNADRRGANPNCLQKGGEVRIFDHETAFIYGRDAGVIGWLPPWQTGGMQTFATPGNHIFKDIIDPDEVDFDRMVSAWREISDARINSYKTTLPLEMKSDEAAMLQVDRALELIRDGRDHIEGCVAELRRVM